MIRADKNAANRDATTVGVVIAFLSVIFWLPFVYSKVIKKDYSKPSYQLDHASS